MSLILLVTSSLLSLALAYVPIEHCTLQVDGNTTLVADGEYELLAGQWMLEGSVYAHCNNGTLLCYEDDGAADAVARDGYVCEEREIRHKRRRLATAELATEMWPESTLCIQIRDNHFSRKEKNFIYSAMDHIKTKTNVNVITRDECYALEDHDNVCGNCRNFVDMHKGKGCHSLIGYKKGRYQKKGQPMSLASGCFGVGIGSVVHEMGHALGLYHEHTNSKRNVMVIGANIKVPPGNYATISSTHRSNKYDKGSIMHYPLGDALCYPKEEYKNIQFCDIDDDPKDSNCVPPEERYCDRRSPLNYGVGQRKGLSPGDIEALNLMYAVKK